MTLQEHNIRSKMIQALKEKFGHLGLTYSIGGQISFDVFPTGQSYHSIFSTPTPSPGHAADVGVGWDKTFSLNHIQDEGFTEIHFFGDKVSLYPQSRFWVYFWV